MTDLRFAFRQLAKSPGFAAVTIAALAIGIGANTAAFSLLNAVLLQTLPVKNPSQLVLFTWAADENVGPLQSSEWSQRDAATGWKTSTSFSVPTFEQLRDCASVLSDVFAFAPFNGLTVAVDGAAEIVPEGQLVSGGYHTGLGVAAAAGRLFALSDDAPAADPVVVISHRYWQRRFGGDPAAIGKSIAVNGVPVTIVGVTEPRFYGAMQVGEVMDLTLPLALSGRLRRGLDDSRLPGNWWVRIMGRLKPEATAAQARAGLESVFQNSARGNLRARSRSGALAIDPASLPPPELRVGPGGQGLYELRRFSRVPLNLLLGVVGLVLLVACANVANLLLARGATRRREIAMRLALGASRGRIVRQLLAESVLLALLGAAAGTALALWGTPLVVAMGTTFGGSALVLDTSLDWRVFGFTTAVAVLTGIVFGLAPALRTTRLDLTAEFMGGARTLGTGSRSRLAKALIVAQVALSFVLLVGTSLLVRTLRNLQSVDVRFNRENLLLFQVDADAGSAGRDAAALYGRVRERLALVPGVRHASFARVAPLSRNEWSSSVTAPGYVPDANDRGVKANAIDPEYLATLELPLLSGRNFTGRDDAAAPKVALVSEAFARKYFGGENAVGRRVRFGGGGAEPDTEIVGVVRDAPYSAVKTAPPPVAYFPFFQAAAGAGPAQFAVRFSGASGALATAVRTAVREVDGGLPVSDVRTQDQQIDRLFAQERLFARLCGFFGGLALVLSAIGLYGLMAYAVSRRTGEIGLRIALGAVPGEIRWMVVRESLGVVALGVAFGAAVSLAATKVIANLLFQLSPTDPVSYAVSIGLMFAVAYLACVLPTRRAAHIDPLTALRSE